jgi:hypothetical protein
MEEAVQKHSDVTDMLNLLLSARSIAALLSPSTSNANSANPKSFHDDRSLSSSTLPLRSNTVGARRKLVVAAPLLNSRTVSQSTVIEEEGFTAKFAKLQELSMPRERVGNRWMWSLTATPKRPIEGGMENTLHHPFWHRVWRAWV